MASTISLSLSNGQTIFLPNQVNVTIAGQAGAKITAVSSQIDDGGLSDVGCLPPLPASPVAASVTIDGLAPNSWHTLSLYAWDDTDPDPTSTSVTFHVFDPGSGPLGPPLGGP